MMWESSSGIFEYFIENRNLSPLAGVKLFELFHFGLSEVANIDFADHCYHPDSAFGNCVEIAFSDPFFCLSARY